MQYVRFDVIHLSFIGFEASSGTETLTFTYPIDTFDFTSVHIFEGSISCDSGCMSPTPMPEPGTMALVGLALAGMGLAARRRKAV